MTAPITVCLIIDCFDHLRAGAEKQFFHLLRRCDRNRFRIRVAALHSLGEEVEAGLDAAGVAVRCLGLKRAYDLHARRRARRLVDEAWVRPGTIVMSCHFGADLFTGLWLRPCVPVRWMSAKRDLGFWMKPHHRLVMRWLQRRMDVITVNTAQAKRSFGRCLGTDEDKIRFIPNGVDVPEIPSEWMDLREAVRERHQAGTQETWFVCVGNIRPVKGQDVLIKAFAQAMEQGLSNGRLILVGEDRMDGRMQALAASCGVASKTVFTGPQEDVRPWLAAADVVVCPSRSEGMSNAVMEAMAFGKSVIATAVGGNLDLIEDGVSGRLTPCDPKALAAAMMEAAADPDRVRSWGRKARDRVKERFDWNAVVREYETLWISLSRDP